MWKLSRGLRLAWAVVPLVIPVFVQAQPWPHLEIDERVIPALSGLAKP